MAAVISTATPAAAQDLPQVITPLRVETDHNGVNLLDGRMVFDTPVLSAPGASNLRFDFVQNAVPYVVGTMSGGGDDLTGNFSIHIGASASESFRCNGSGCLSVTESGSTFSHPNTRYYRQAGSGAYWHFNLKHQDSGVATSPRTYQYYAQSVEYPNGEIINYDYGPKVTFMGRDYYRPVAIRSNLGYRIDLTYQSDTFGSDGQLWATLASATLYSVAAPGTPLGRLSYSNGGTTITDHGSRALNDPGGRTYTCTGCGNQLGVNLERSVGSIQLPGESSPTLQVTELSHPTARLVSSITRDGVVWNYSYANLRQDSTSHAWLYDSATVTGPQDFRRAYTMGVQDHRNILTGMTERVSLSTDRTTTYQYYPNSFRPRNMILPELNATEVAYDMWGNIVSRSTIPKPNTGTAVVETASLGETCADVLCYRLRWYRDALNRQTDYDYNADGQLTRQVEPAVLSGARRTTYSEYTPSSQGVSRRTRVRICEDDDTCPAGTEVRTEYEYWNDTQLPSLERTVDVATGAQIATTFTYDAAGRVTSEDGPLAGVDDARFYRYDVYGRRTWEIEARGTNGFRVARRHTYRDSDDKVVSTETGTIPNQDSTDLTVLTRTDFTYDSRRYAVRQAVSVAGTTQSVVDRAYDDRGLLICEAIRMNPAAFASTPGACAHTAAGSQGPDRITQNSYDAAGQLTQVIRAYLTPLQQNYASYGYSLNGRQTSVVDANSNRAEMTYDGFDRQRRWIFPHPSAPGTANPADYEEYGYDAVGNRTSLRKRDQSVITYQYDGLNRMTAKLVPERTGLDPVHTRDVFYGYDVRGLTTYARFDSHTGQGVNNAYDSFGRMTSSTIAMGSFARTLSYQYDAAGNRTRIQHPDGQAFNYEYDSLNRLTRILDPIGSQVITQTYETWGPRSAIGRHGGASGFQVTPDGRLTSISHYLAPGGSLNVNWTFTHNPAGQIATVARSNDAYAWMGHYNVNRNYTVNGLNQYVTAGQSSFQYDANGNLVSDGTRSFQYDVENRLVGASGGGIVVSLGYDPLGRLLWTTGNPNYATFLHDGDRLVAEYDSGGSLTDRYVHGSGVDEPLIWYSAGNRRYLIGNHQGSIVGVTDALSSLLAVNTYDPWGIPGANGLGRFRYTGQMWLPELGLYYYKARMYSPTLGRFMQVDPIGYDDQINLYAYVGNNPVNAVDPTGENTECGSRIPGMISVSCSGETVLGQIEGMNSRRPGEPWTFGGGGGEGPLTGRSAADRRSAEQINDFTENQRASFTQSMRGTTLRVQRNGNTVSGSISRDGRDLRFTGRLARVPGRQAIRIEGLTFRSPRGTVVSSHPSAITIYTHRDGSIHVNTDRPTTIRLWPGIINLVNEPAGDRRLNN